MINRAAFNLPRILAFFKPQIRVFREILLPFSEEGPRDRRMSQKTRQTEMTIHPSLCNQLKQNELTV